MRVLFATAEFSPYVKVGGLGDFSAGVVAELARQGIEVEVVLPDYGATGIETMGATELAVPDWAEPAVLRHGLLGGVPFGLITVPGITRDNPYVDPQGEPWPDNDSRFLAFSAAVAALSDADAPDVIHLNDWHTSAVPAFASRLPPSVLTIHNLAYQGDSESSWVGRFPHNPSGYRREGKTNPLAGGIALADRVVMVSPTFAAEAGRPETGFGLDDLIRHRGTDVTGILNGIDTTTWNPLTDPHLDFNYGIDSSELKSRNKERLVTEMGWKNSDEPLLVMVTRLTQQKGIDLALSLVPKLSAIGARMVLLGSGEQTLSDAAQAAQQTHPGRFAFREGYDEPFAHRLFGASDLYLMPSRFEPAGLTQMQAMRYGSIPVATPVGGLNDTVIDADSHQGSGNGFLARDIDSGSVEQALIRSVAAWHDQQRRTHIQRNGMSRDWSWEVPARLYSQIYEEVRSAR